MMCMKFVCTLTLNRMHMKQLNSSLFQWLCFHWSLNTTVILEIFIGILILFYESSHKEVSFSVGEASFLGA